MVQNIIYIKLLKNLKKLDIKFHKFNRNMGISVNFLKVIKMAKGEFVWMIGSDDMLTPDALSIWIIYIETIEGLILFL